jgi:hypothetical protein
MVKVKAQAQAKAKRSQQVWDYREGRSGFREREGAFNLAQKERPPNFQGKNDAVFFALLTLLFPCIKHHHRGYTAVILHPPPSSISLFIIIVTIIIAWNASAMLALLSVSAYSGAAGRWKMEDGRWLLRT